MYVCMYTIKTIQYYIIPVNKSSACLCFALLSQKHYLSIVLKMSKDVLLSTYVHIYK